LKIVFGVGHRPSLRGPIYRNEAISFNLKICIGLSGLDVPHLRDVAHLKKHCDLC